MHKQFPNFWVMETICHFGDWSFRENSLGNGAEKSYSECGGFLYPAFFMTIVVVVTALRLAL